ncbi:flagellar filament capping protein FliD [Gracilibacillus massiliensis]|uniref:flagellar filament capping protein FliD n=1 Tax=Gracilibacillus massiliensis TaxID=1564956 RepID=UPI00071D3646|nr:flagellar filament capping protein FliD [Gracilibacillus massiliensis]
MRISGFASGMDIDQMVNDLMKAESMPLQRMEQEKQTLEWKRDDYRAMNTLLLDFRSKLTDMRMTTSYRSRETSSTNENLVSATASSAASQSSFELSEVKQLAKSASWVNEAKVSSDVNDPINASETLLSQQDKLAGFSFTTGAIYEESITASADDEPINLDHAVNLGGEDALSVQVDGKNYKVVTDSADLTEDTVLLNGSGLEFASGVIQEGSEVSVQYAISGETNEETKTLADGARNLQLDGRSLEGFELQLNGNTYTMSADPNEDGLYDLVNSADPNDKIGLMSKDLGRIAFDEGVIDGETELTATYSQNYTSFGVGSETSEGAKYQDFIIRGNESLNQVVSKVNSADLGVSMMYDSYSDRVSLRRTETGDYGTGNDMSLSGSFMTDALNFAANPDPVTNTNYSEGQNATFTINGLETERHTNNFQIDGVTFNLKQKFDVADGPVSIGVTNDSDAVFENIKEFVETYNTLIGEINGKVNEEYYRDYSPLTDDQRESLTETQQEDWEEMAKSGLLRRDSILQSALSTMRTDFYSPVNNGDSQGSFNQLAQIGITTTRNYMDGGKLEIDEAKLREAIESDPSGVENLFRGDGEEFGEKGIARRLTDSVNNTMDRIYERAGRATATNQQFTIGRNLEDVEDQIQQFQDRLTQIEDRYWRQFTAMEKAMQQANQQASYMMQQFGGMGMQ